MKKAVVSILAVFYLGLASGATVHFHYCMDELINWGISQEQSDKCSNCGMKKGDAAGCCKDQNQKLELEDPQKTFSIVYRFQNASTSLFLVPLNYAQQNFIYSTQLPPAVSAAPLRTQVTPVFIRNCSFRI